MNAIASGHTDSQIARDCWAGSGDPVAERAKAECLYPQHRVGTPKVVAMTAFLPASDEATFINAESIVIDEGKSAFYHGQIS